MLINPTLEEYDVASAASDKTAECQTRRSAVVGIHDAPLPAPKGDPLGMTALDLARVMLAGLIAGIDADSEIPVQRAELAMLQVLLKEPNKLV